MKISFHRFKLTPKVALNHLSSLKPREGVFLKSESAKGIGYCEYFPHSELGDESVDDFLKTFMDQKSCAQKKSYYFLNPKWIDLDINKKFFNHQFFQWGDSSRAGIIKYKIRHLEDFSFLGLIDNNTLIRLDANGLFDQQSWGNFVSKIPKDYFPQIDYIEDPLHDGEWSIVPIPCAEDFIQGSPSSVKIFKPYREFFPTEKKRVVFSGNMGHGLSNYQSYLELVQRGDLNETHGLLTDSIYEETPQLFKGSHHEGYLPHSTGMANYLDYISSLPWTRL